MTRQRRQGPHPVSGQSTMNPIVDMVMRNRDRAIEELQTAPAAALKLLPGIELANATDVHVAHGLGRPPRWVGVSCARGGTTAGEVLEVRSGNHDRNLVMILRAVGYGATVTVDILVL